MGSPDFDLVAASLRADRGDLEAFVEALAVKLEGALPGAARVSRGGGRLFGGGTKRVERIAVQLGPDEYELEHGRGALDCRRRTVVRGIALKNETLSVDEWIDAVSRALVAEADESEHARIALERLLDA
ncbi:MAG TPA: hypothetical protein VHV52_03895 [Gaiellaceae bacterium]|nr:hypothetical protein [Gaiellaceae bacterium]